MNYDQKIKKSCLEVFAPKDYEKWETCYDMCTKNVSFGVKNISSCFKELPKADEI